jgi:hypothetical protein
MAYEACPEESDDCYPFFGRARLLKPVLGKAMAVVNSLKGHGFSRAVNVDTERGFSP